MNRFRILFLIQFSFVSAALAITPEERIDELVEAGLVGQKLAPNAEIDDATFLRRAYLNIAGRIPTIEEGEEFHNSEYPNKRELLIEQLLDGEGYVSNFYNFWADLLRLTERDGASADAYQLWLKDALRINKPYDEMVREMVSAKGEIWDNGAVGYYFRDRGMPLDNMSNTVRIFLGVRLECAQCHNHPFDKWTQMDYYQMAAFSYGMQTRNYQGDNRTLVGRHQKEAAAEAFSKAAEKAAGVSDFPYVSAKGMEKAIAGRKIQQWMEANGLNERKFRRAAAAGEKAMAEVMANRDGVRRAMQQLYDPLKYITVSEAQRDLKLPHDYQYTDAKPLGVVPAATMFGAEIDLDDIDSSISAYADWMTTRENPTFTRVIANRLWKEVFGIGIIEPADEITENTKPSNPELLAYLEELIRELDYDMKEFLKILYNTQSYQRSANTGELVMGQPYYFQGPVLQRMSAEQIWDSIVGLALPEADHYKPRLKTQLTSVERQRLIYTSLEERPIDEFIAMVEELAPIIANKYESEEKIREQMFKAREAGDDERYNRLRAELKDASRVVSDKIAEIGYIHLQEKVDGGELLTALGIGEAAPNKMNPIDSSSEQLLVTTSLPKVQMPEMPKGLSKTDQRVWAREHKTGFNVYRSLIGGMARASELESPARRGHFLRDFGQSDREVIENAAENASVPQALNLLNGPIVQALTNPHSVFGRRIHAAGDPDEKTRMIFQAMLTREPTAAELETVRAEIDAYGEEAYEGVVWALLNTQQFLFVQ
ncbi:MAG: hypothetical protein ACI8UO_006114 [Verrucomicrobiales bacterium]|jgi:hypothetical protein